MTEDKLKPCPFCGSKMGVGRYPKSMTWSLIGNHDEDCIFYRICPPVVFSEENLKLLVDAWNRRLKSVKR